MTETNESRDDTAPIDVSCHKLLDWLLAASLIKSRWPPQLSALSARIDALLPLLPPSVTAQLSLSSLPFTYYSALQAEQLLTASSSTSGLGKAAHPALHSLQSVLSAYRRHNLHLAHTAQLLQQYAAFDIPEARRSIQACTLQTAELQRRLADSRKAAEAARDRQRKECGAVGMELAERADADFKQQVVAGLQELPALLQTVQERAKAAAVGDALLLYEGWLQWMQRDEKTALKDRRHRLTALREVRERQPDPFQQQQEANKQSLQSDPTGLLSPPFRSRFQSDVSELSAFLSSRLSDLTLSASSLSPLASQLVSSCLASLSPCFSASALSRLLQSVAAVDEALQGKSLQRLLRLAAGEGELERAVAAVSASQLSAARGEAVVKQLQDRLEAARLQREKEAVRLREMEAASISWRRAAEEDIAQLLHRKVSIRD